MSHWDDMDEGLSLQPRAGRYGLMLTLARTQPKRRTPEGEKLIHQATVVGLIWGVLLVAVLMKAAS